MVSLKVKSFGQQWKHFGFISEVAQCIKKEKVKIRQEIVQQIKDIWGKSRSLGLVTVYQSYKLHDDNPNKEMPGALLSLNVIIKFLTIRK